MAAILPFRVPVPETLPAIFDPTLIRRFDLNGPRYTSYPTADRFADGFTADHFAAAVRGRETRAAGPPFSIYVHLPFCNTVCFYCACNKIVTRDKSRATRYIEYLEREIELQCAVLGDDRRVAAMHWGGGTPTFLPDHELRQVAGMFAGAFRFEPGAERAIEIDPRSCTPATIELLASLGFNRASLGVQDFDPEVQKAVNRVQSVEATRDIIEAARAHGFRSVNVDLIYGLPKQTVATFTATVEKVLALRPGRIALYSYAHLPTRFKPQRRIVSADLPPAGEKLGILSRAIDMFNAAGYVYIGMDHFALPDDELARSQREGTLIRNFQGYAVGPDTDLLAFGVSAIAKVGATYSQNSRDVVQYYQALDGGRLPIARGIELTPDDLARRAIIGSLMCQFGLSMEAIESAHGLDFVRDFAAEVKALQEFVDLGLVELRPGIISVTPRGRFFVRAIAAVFDRYLRADRERVAYSRII